MKRSYIMVLILYALITVACGGTKEVIEPTPIPAIEEEKTTEVYYILSVAIEPNEGGIAVPEQENLLAGTEITVQVKASPGYEFEGWSGASTSTSPSLTLTMDGDKGLTAHFKKIQTKTPRPTPTATPEPCVRPADVTKDHVGELIEVCGKVTNFGDQPCPDCPLGGYGFLKLDKEFLILSYEWVFNEGWLDTCLVSADTVEMLGNDPVFIMGKGEGYAGSECTYDDAGNMSCEGGDYFLEWYGCD
jgi:uncharacterized repeat protein (TIGR02543 family)